MTGNVLFTRHLKENKALEIKTIILAGEKIRTVLDGNVQPQAKLHALE